MSQVLGGTQTRTTPSESLLSLHQVAKCLTMKLAVHLAKEVAAILRAVLTHETKKLYNDSTVHLLCSNYWIQPIYQELLHSSSRYNATREGERKRPSSGLARVAAYPKPPKQRKPSASCENHVRELRTFFTVVLEPNIHTFSVLSETLPDFLKSQLC